MKLIFPALLLFSFASAFAGTVETSPQADADGNIYISEGGQVSFTVSPKKGTVTVLSSFTNGTPKKSEKAVQTVTFGNEAVGESNLCTIKVTHKGTDDETCPSAGDFTYNVIIPKITSKTVVSSPSNRDRTTIAIGEDVDLKIEPFAIVAGGEWSIEPSSSGTSLFSTTGANVGFTAGEKAEQFTVNFKRSGKILKSIDFSVIEPSGVLMEVEPSTISSQQTPTLGIYYKTKIYIQPDTVNFSKIKTSEGTDKASTSGYFDYEKDLEHLAGSEISVSNTVTAGKGTLSNGDDTISGGATELPYSNGEFKWSIPWSYHIGSTNKVFSTVNQIKKLEMVQGKAKMTISKAGASQSVSEP